MCGVRSGSRSTDDPGISAAQASLVLWSPARYLNSVSTVEHVQVRMCTRSMLVAAPRRLSLLDTRARPCPAATSTPRQLDLSARGLAIARNVSREAAVHTSNSSFGNLHSTIHKHTPAHLKRPLRVLVRPMACQAGNRVHACARGCLRIQSSRFIRRRQILHGPHLSVISPSSRASFLRSTVITSHVLMTTLHLHLRLWSDFLSACLQESAHELYS